MVDVLYLAHNRLAFTKASMAAMLSNTDWSSVARLVIYDDVSGDGTCEFLRALKYPVETVIIRQPFGSPVAIMNDFVAERQPQSVFAKIDNDTMLPPGWLGTCLELMKARPDIDLLGIEAMFRTAADGPRKVEPARFIGGIGLMKTKVFTTLPVPHGRFGFTAFQDKQPDIRKGWIYPSLPVFLLDRLPTEPWASLSAEYEARGWQRPWKKYENDFASEWWKDTGLADEDLLTRSAQ